MTVESTAVTSLDSTGRVVLPAGVRKQLHLAAGTRFSVEVVADRIELRPEPTPEAAVVRKAGRLVLKANGEAFDAAAAIQTERQTQGARPRRG
jgi:AbrB family looped-hinge helix DNA binding protein